MKTLLLALCLGATVAALSANQYDAKQTQLDFYDPVESVDVQPMVEFSFHTVTIDEQIENGFILLTNVSTITLDLAADVPVYTENSVCSFNFDSFISNRRAVVFDFRNSIPSKRFLC